MRPVHHHILLLVTYMQVSDMHVRRSVLAPNVFKSDMNEFSNDSDQNRLDQAAPAIAQLVERWASDRKAADYQFDNVLLCPCERHFMLISHCGRAVYPLWGPAWRKTCEQNPKKGCFALVWLDKRSVWFIRTEELDLTSEKWLRQSDNRATDKKIVTSTVWQTRMFNQNSK